MPCPRRDETSQKGGEKRWATHSRKCHRAHVAAGPPRLLLPRPRPPSCPPWSNTSHSSSGGMGILFAHFDSASCNCEEHQCLRARDLQSATVRSRVSLSPPSSPFPSNLTCEEERAGESAGGSYGALPRAHPFGSSRPSRAEGDEVSTDSRDRSAWQHGITDRITHSCTHARRDFRFHGVRNSPGMFTLHYTHLQDCSLATSSISDCRRKGDNKEFPFSLLFPICISAA